MVQIGKVLFDGEKGQINLELSQFVEDNFTKKEDDDIQVLWSKLAAKIESALSRYSTKELNKNV